MSDAATPLANQLLIALPSLADPNFARAVALICQHDEDGAMGIVINRASEYTLGEVFEQMQIDTTNEALRGQVVLAGGPVHPERGFVLHDGGSAWDSTLPIAENLWLTTSRDILIAMAEGKGPGQAVVALGCAGWGAGQLEYELVENTWLTVGADPAVFFELPLDRRWEAAAGLIGVDLMHLTDYSGNA